MILNKIALKKGSKKLINAWAFYDWANSVYPLVISSAVFPIYYGSLFVSDLYVEVFGFNFKKSPKQPQSVTFMLVST